MCMLASYSWSCLILLSLLFSVPYHTTYTLTMTHPDLYHIYMQWQAHDGVVLCVDWNVANNMIVSGGEVSDICSIIRT